MKKANFTSLSAWTLCFVALLFGFSSQAQAPAGQTEITISFNAGAFANEISWELVNTNTNTVVECVAQGTFTGASVVTNIVDNEPYEFRAFDSFGDSWNGWGVTITATEDASNNGCANALDGVVLAENTSIPDPGNPSFADCVAGPSGDNFVGLAFTAACPECEITCPPSLLGIDAVSSEPGLCGANFTSDPPATTMDCLPPATPINLTLDYDGDHGTASIESFDIVGPDGTIVAAGVNSGADCSAGTENFTVDGSLWNAWITNFGDVTFTFNPTSTGINPFICNNVFILTGSYQDDMGNTVNINETVPYSFNGNTYLATDLTISAPAMSFLNTINYTHTLNGGTAISGVFDGFLDVGIHDICYQSVDAFGNIAECCFQVEIADTEAPAITVDGAACPPDAVIVENLDPGACEIVVNFDVQTTDNCPLVAPVSQFSSSDMTDQLQGWGGNFSDLTNETAFPIDVQSVDLLLDGGTWDLEIYTTTSSNTFVGVPAGTPGASDANWTYHGTANVTSGGVGAPTNIAIPFTIPANSTKGLYITVTQAPIGGGPISYEINVNGNTATNGDLTMVAGVGVTYPWNVAFGTPGSATNYRRIEATFNYNQDLGVVGLNQTAGLPSGSSFPIGTTINTFEANDVAGNVSTCDVLVTVNEFANPVSTLACNDNIQVSLDEDCSSVIGADMVLEGGPYGCYDDYVVDVLTATGGSLGNTVDASFIGSTWTVKVTDPDTGNSCWGSLTVEDKLDPTVECEDENLFACDGVVIPTNTPPAPVVASASSAGPTGSFGGGGFPQVVEQSADISGVPSAAIITNVEVELQVTHTWVGDLEIDLIAPNGVTTRLQDNICGNGQNIDATYTDAGMAAFCVGGSAATLSGLVQPDDAFAVYNDGSANGTWTVRITDTFADAQLAGGGGTFDNLTVTITSQEQFILAATADDNCGVASLTYIDNLENGDCGGPAGTITRVWTATDFSGNTGSCEQTITLDRPTLANVAFPGDATFDCASPEAADWYVSEQEGGVPVIAGQAVTSGDLCDISCEVSEETTLDVCEGTLKILRTWTCVDWCAGESTSATQILKLSDEDGPAVSAPAELTIDVYDASAPASSIHDVCAGHVVVPPAATTGDNCSGVAGWITQLWAVDANCDPIELIQVIETNGGIFWDVALLANGQPARYTVRYVATDGCGNESDATTCITTVDKVPPVAICDEITEITVTNNGATGEGCSTLYAENLDDGSYDNCKPVWFLMAKMSEAPFSQDLLTRCFYPSRDFCCDEVGTTQQVILLVLDADPSALFFNLNQPFIGCDGTPGLVGTALQGSNINYNTCMVEVIVDDKLPPINTFCPGPQTITCDQYWDDYEAGLLLCEQQPNEDECQDDFLTPDFGSPVFYDNCAVNVTPNVTVNLDQCGEGTIVRSWSAVDDVNNGPATCTQTIFVNHVSDWAVMFPDDKFVDCGVEVPDFGEPVLYHETCELLAVSYEDELFTTVPDACYKLVREWTVINWCTVGNDIDQEIVEPSECDSGMDYNGNGINCAMNSPIGNNGTIIGHGHRTFREDANTPDGYITYQQVIKVNDTVDPVFNDCSIEDMCIFDGCTMTVTLPQPDVSDCSDDVTITVESTTLPGGANGFGPYINVGPGTYTVVYKATDNCGNWSVCETEFSVEDCKNPTPYCVDGLNIEIMNTNPPMVDIWASDFDAGSFDNCQVVCIAFEPTCPTPNNPTDQLVFTCDQVGEQLIQLWVYDGVNWDFCETFVNIQDNMVQCGGDDPQVQGNIATESNEDVAGVEVQINSSNFNSMYTTDATGMFSVDVPANGDYSITPVKDVNPLNGVTTFDLVQISKHILNIDMLDTPYQMIAADANKSGGITTFDMVQVRKLILYIDSEFANNTSWRFVPKSYNFTDASNPFADNFPEVINLNNVTVNQLAQDFVAIKIGDVNGSANTNNLLGADDRNFNGALTLSAEDIRVEAGKTYNVEFTANNFNHFGYQFTLNYNGLEFVEVGAGLATAENFGTALVSENAITASWNKADAVNLSSDEAVFTLAFTAKTTAQLSDLLSIDSRYTAAESYASNGDIQDVNLEFNGTVVANGFELFQNTPNPFSDATVIGFSLPTATTATITISDISGRVLKTIEGDFAKGYNQVDVTRDGIPASGVLYYQLDTDTDSATKKMILID